MKAGIITAGSGAILVLTDRGSFEDPDLVKALHQKGVDKYVEFEVPLDLVKRQYGQHYSVIMADRKQTDLLRVVDVDGQRIFKNFPLSVFGPPLCYEEPTGERKAA
ncbi:MAG: hypothetical protein WAN11_27250 [Syntrophobacteraceae bacterium]